MLAHWRYYLLSFLATIATAVAGSVASIQSQSFYQEVERPSWAPPPQLFGPVWTVLYLMIAISAGMALTAAPPERRTGIGVMLIIQFALNALWTWIFFVWRNGALAFVDIVALWMSIIVLIFLFWRYSKVAAAMLIPYLLWVSFAAALNFAIWRSNPGLL
ncbi:MAG: TspO/MBR family protein [Fimbriimonadales bacterium]